MNKYFGIVLANIPAILLFCIAGYLVINSLAGWGWFLFLGLLCTHTFSKEDK